MLLVLDKELRQRARPYMSVDTVHDVALPAGVLQRVKILAAGLDSNVRSVARVKAANSLLRYVDLGHASSKAGVAPNVG